MADDKFRNTGSDEWQDTSANQWEEVETPEPLSDSFADTGTDQWMDTSTDQWSPHETQAAPVYLSPRSTVAVSLTPTRRAVTL